MKKILYVFIFLITFVSKAEQYVYPVAEFDAGNQIAVIHQKSIDNIEVWFLNQKYDTAIKGLSSFLTPANLRIIPSENGFSFIDQGYIKIKYFEKRSAKTLAIYEPISLFSSMNWIDEHSFYFTAREGDFYQIFCTDDEASNIQRVSNEAIDFLYPQKIHDKLFCIKRTFDQQFKIIEQLWSPVEFNSNKTFTETIVLPESSQPLCFLHMISESEGFYLQAPRSRQYQENDLYEFSCHHLIKIGSEWRSEKLFAFQIPLKYIHGSHRLYESIEPFLPKYGVENHVYFSSYNQNLESFEILNFDISTKKIAELPKMIVRNKNYKTFTPYIYNAKMYRGIIFNDTEIIDFSQKHLLKEIFLKDTNN